MKIGVVMGTRPEIAKNYSIVKALREKEVDFFVLHTNQHSDVRMQESIFLELGYQADFIMRGEYCLGKAIDWVRDKISNLGLDMIIVNGDTAAALIGTIAGMYSDVQVAHVEAGLRSFDHLMYEERNRIMVDTVAQLLFAYTQQQAAYLASQKEIRGDIYSVGNTTVDLINDFQNRFNKMTPSKYAFVTLHRKEFTDRKDLMIKVFHALNSIAYHFDNVYLPLHPRTKDAIQNYGLTEDLFSNLIISEPLPVLESLSYIRNASLVLTDSGCVQEEAYIFKVPCLTLRQNTEREQTLFDDANIVTGFSPSSIAEAAVYQLNREEIEYTDVYGPPGAGRRIVDIICSRAST